ncbi:hypothetical protein JMJ77_0012984 [Colletotrichum scovillei]|uniref:Uncharacterized protein n=1 Tax=Colletotrichum scovillei TaxID=1209932 RepID=A0A9P7R4U2_9PEZI|nr:hypothetical protein JMJ77_0012984 [Colletotrichum scovillei]KAG7069272.1 hypothetical protein JMJ76_0002945 [Colletotrichum scovillei]KAG7073186.1 hypothetical protein JMJ78_0014165 [Colletotrichum scovillei]
MMGPRIFAYSSHLLQRSPSTEVCSVIGASSQVLLCVLLTRPPGSTWE